MSEIPPDAVIDTPAVVLERAAPHRGAGTIATADVTAPAGWQERLKTNNFDLLRLLLAVGVMFSHLSVLTRQSAYASLARLSDSTVLVQSFFVISGFLIFMSYEKSKSLTDYFSKRMRRIYPAYFVMILLCFTTGLILTRLPAAAYFSWKALRYLAANLTFLVFLQPTLPGVFGSNPIPAVNGSLWTLKIEVAFYVFVPLFCWLMRRGNRVLLLALVYAASLIYAATWDHFGNHEAAKQFPGQLSFFVAGAALYYYFERFAKNASLWFVLALAVLHIHGIWPVGWLVPASIGVITIFLACLLPNLGGVGRFGDLSYGFYIYHFPVIQTFEYCGVFRWNIVGGFFLSVGLTGLLAFASWHLVEKRFLRKSSHYRQSSEGHPHPSPAMPANT